MRVSDTIVALSTPPGRSGIGVIRLSGPHALNLVRAVSRDERLSLEPNRASLKVIYSPETGELLDRAVVTYFKAPHSFTGEDTVELSCHGSPVLLTQVIDTLLRQGARPADPGEFTLRAISNGRLNLSQAEAIRDLIDAQTQNAVRQATRQLGGELSARLQPIKDSLIQIIVPFESSLEFVEDDLPAIALERVDKELIQLINSLDSLSSTFRSGRLLKEGLRVTLVGRPNVGKSSIFNKLLVSDRAIVTDIPGTTRDSLSELLDINGIPVLLTDTAGVRDSNDPIEHIGIERTRRAMADADLILIVLDGSTPLTPEDSYVFAEVSERYYLVVLNKNDLDSFSFVNYESVSHKRIAVSAKTGVGLDALRVAITEPFTSNEIGGADFLITNARHYDLLRRASESMRCSNELIRQHASEELIMVGLYDALRYLGQITGETTPEDVLSQIFATFCIGK